MHVGTNDIANNEPEEIVNGIADIVNIIHEESPATKHVLSEMTLRTDKPSYKAAIGRVMRGKTRHLRISLAIKKHESKIKYFFHNEYVK